MLVRKPQPAFWKFVKGSAKVVFVLEAVGFAVSYGVWYRMNTNRDFRQYVHENYPSFLEGYYRIGELFGDNNTRKLDKTVWSQESDKHDSN